MGDFAKEKQPKLCKGSLTVPVRATIMSGPSGCAAPVGSSKRHSKTYYKFSDKKKVSLQHFSLLCVLSE